MFSKIPTAFYGQILSLKNQNRDLKVLVAVGGATERTTGFDAVSSDTERTRVFVDNVIAFLRQNGFDGLDVDWEFPTSRTRSNYQRFVQVRVSHDLVGLAERFTSKGQTCVCSLLSPRVFFRIESYR